jgi:hypothetical protein
MFIASVHDFKSNIPNYMRYTSELAVGLKVKIAEVEVILLRAASKLISLLGVMML